MSKSPRKIFNITCSGHGRELFLYLFPRIKKGSLSTMMELCLSSSIGNDTLFCLFHRGINQTTQFILLIYQRCTCRCKYPETVHGALMIHVGPWPKWFSKMQGNFIEQWFYFPVRMTLYIIKHFVWRSYSKMWRRKLSN